MLIISKIYKKNHPIDPNHKPSVSFIVAAYNEEKVIADKIQNTFSLDYPSSLTELIVVSDGSTDNTPKIAKQFESNGVTSLHKPERAGKTAALNRAVAIARNQILVFSDANSMFRKDALSKLTQHFIDSEIGGVCGRKAVLQHKDRKASIGDNLFWNYESALKQAEGDLFSVATGDGEIFAIRRELYQTIPDSFINDDMAMTFNIVQNNKRVIYDKTAITEEEASITLKDDFNVKSRMVYGGIQAMATYSKLLNPLTSWFGFQFFFHKALRYFMWFLLALIYLSNLTILDSHAFYSIFFFLQNLFYALALIGWAGDKFKFKTGPCYLPYYYCNVNFAAFKGFLFYLKQRSTVDIWKKAQR